MRAILIATGISDEEPSLGERSPVPLLPLLDRPFIQHVVEYCASKGIRQFDFVLSHYPERIEHLLGDGKRWGCTFTYHLARDAGRPYRFLKALDIRTEPGTPLLFGHADRLPALPLAEARAAFTDSGPVLLCRGGEGGHGRWTGWALLPGAQLAALPPEADEKGLEAHLRSAAGGAPSCLEVGRCLGMRTYQDVLAANQAVLAKEFTGLLLTGQEVNEGVWLSRNVVLHPTAEVVAPVYVGENCEIGPAVKFGPGAVVGDGCVLDAHCTVTRSVIYPHSYVGQALELDEVIVDRNRLINVRVGVPVTVNDTFILGSLSESHFRGWLNRALSRLAGATLLLLSLPLLLLTALWLRLTRRGPVLYKQKAVRLPVTSEEDDWRTFTLRSFVPEAGPGPAPFKPCSLRALLLRVLPGLWSVAKGHMSLVGVSPRTPEEVRGLPPDWRSLYLSSKPGLVTEAAVRYEGEPSEDEAYAAEAYYTAAAGWKYDLKLFLSYLARALFGHARPKTVPIPSDAAE